MKSLSPVLTVLVVFLSSIIVTIILGLSLGLLFLNIPTVFYLVVSIGFVLYMYNKQKDNKEIRNECD